MKVATTAFLCKGARMRKVAVVVLLVVALTGAACSSEESKSAKAEDNGKATVVWDEAGIHPENLQVAKQVKDSGAFERVAEQTNKIVGLPHDLEIKVSDDGIPKEFDDPSTSLDGRTIYWPAAWLKTSHDALAAFVPEVIRDKGVPKVIGPQNFNADTLNVWSNQFILGHEMGHALIHQYPLPMTGLEEDSADGYATFTTITDKQTGPNAALGAAVLFDSFSTKKPNVTMEEFSSDHPVVQSRIYNFLCSVVGSDPKQLENSLVTDGYLPQTRAPLCPKEWAQLNYGWRKILEPHSVEANKAEAKAALTQARKDLDTESAVLAAKLKELRAQQSQQGK
jgi:hypothetical protein